MLATSFLSSAFGDAPLADTLPRSRFSKMSVVGIDRSWDDQMMQAGSSCTAEPIAIAMIVR